MRGVIILLLWLGLGSTEMTSPITYHEHIEPILQNNCVPCHQKGEVGAMPLTNFEEVASYGRMIAFVTETKLMPPFLADDSKHLFKGAKQLTDTEIQLIQQWVEGGLLEGEKPNIPTSLPLMPTTMEHPDTTFAMSEAFEQYGIYYDQYRVFSIPTNFNEDKYVSAIEFVPGNKKIVRQAMISIDTSARFEYWDEWDPQYGYFSFGELGFVPTENRWYSWSPTQTFTSYPNKTARLLPQGAKLLLHIHYGPTGVPAKDSSFINLKFAEKPIDKIVQTAPLINLHNITNDTFFIPANDVVRFHAKFTVPHDITLLSLMPQANFLGRKWEIFSVAPESQKAETLLKITDWDFHWKQNFEYIIPKKIPKGTIIHSLAEYDNTSKNLANPSEPPRDMEWGKRMYEELFLVYFTFIESFDENSSKPFFKLSPTATNISRDQLTFSFSTQKSAKFSMSIFNFEGKELLPVFVNQSYQKGDHHITTELSALEKGNYYFELSSAGLSLQRIFVYLEKNIFD